MGKIIKLDEKNRKILSILANNSRTPITQIAKKVALSRDAVKYRIDQLEKNGVIQGFRTIINAKTFGYDSYHLFLQFRDFKKIEILITKIKEYPFVRAILSSSGSYDLQVALIARSLQEFDSMLNKILTDCGDSIQECAAFPISKTLIKKALPASIIKSTNSELISNNYEPDKSDMQILEILANDARCSLIDISKEVGLTSDAIRYRMKNLKDIGLIERYMPAIDFKKLGLSMHTLLLNVSGLTDEIRLKEILDCDPHVIWAVKSIGKYNVILYACVKNAQQIHETIDKLRENFTITSYRTLIIKKSHKYTYLPPQT